MKILSTDYLSLLESCFLPIWMKHSLVVLLWLSPCLFDNVAKAILNKNASLYMTHLMSFCAAKGD